MTIDEAIEILTTGSPSQENATFKMWEEAHQLGIEALKCILSHRAEFGNIPYTGLPSETS